MQILHLSAHEPKGNNLSFHWYRRLLAANNQRRRTPLDCWQNLSIHKF